MFKSIHFFASLLFFTGGGGSEICHFCAKRVYVVERMSAESKFFHRSCFRCDYCNVLLRLGSYVYHREGQFAGKITDFRQHYLSFLS